jgi:hypothetical protein
MTSGEAGKRGGFATRLKVRAFLYILPTYQTIYFMVSYVWNVIMFQYSESFREPWRFNHIVVLYRVAQSSRAMLNE